jgi:general stress protein 26
MKVKIEGTQYSRDLSTMAVLCTDNSVAEKYKSELNAYYENVRRDKEINMLKTEISEIKSMIKTLIDRG